MNYEKLVEATRKELLRKLLITEKEADRLAEEIVKKFQKELAPDLSNLDELIDKYLEDYANSLADKLFENLKAAAEIGVLPALSISTITENPDKTSLAAKVAEELLNYRYPDGLNLSERVWNWKRELREGLKRTLLNQARIRASAQKIAYELQYTIEQIEKGKFTITLAEEQLPKIVKKLRQTALLSAANGGDLTEWRKVVKQTENYVKKLTNNIQYGLKPAYKKLLKDLEKAIAERSEEAINETVKWWIYDKQLYNLKRIVRTEVTNTYHLSVIKSTEKNSAVVGYRWTLSRSHKIRDICDDLAHRDHYSLGPGIFPKDKVPRIKTLASHPQCLCYIVPVRADEVKGMDKVKRTQIQARSIFRDFQTLFSNVKDDKELVETFRSIFSSNKVYWSHLRKHAIPSKVAKELGINSWKDAMRKSKKLFPYQVNYAAQFLDTLGHMEKLALQELPNSSIARLIIFSSKNRLAVILDESGKVASLFELDIFRNWGEWKSNLISKGALLLEVPIDEELRKTSSEIRERSKTLFGRS